MARYTILLATLLPFISRGYGLNIFATHFSGSVYTLTFNPSTNNLALNSSVTIGGKPSWMHWDSVNRVIYSTDEATSGTASVKAISASSNGGLVLSVKATSPSGGVACVQYGNGGYLALAHYESSSISTFKLPLSSSSKAQQTFALTLPGPGTIPSRQEAAHPHHTILDPTGTILLVPDLGADLIRIYSIGSGGILTACTSYVEAGGTGPRHGAFSTNGKILYVGNELANTVHAFTFTYANGCLALTRFQTLTTFVGNSAAPKGNQIGEVKVKDGFLYVSNRKDLSFAPNDSIATFALDSAGTMKFLDITSSGGTFPRTFDISKAGDLVVIGDQTTANVVVVKRNPTTGRLGPQLASLRVGSAGTVDGGNGLSAVLWDQ